MNKYIMTAIVLTAASLQARPMQEPECKVVDQSYVHKYGFEVDPSEWSKRGAHGQKITTLNTGVTVVESYSFGELDGDTTYSFPYSTAVQNIERYSKGTLIEKETRSRNGIPQARTEFLGGSHNRMTHWYDSGTPRAVEETDGNFVINGKYYNPAGQIESELSEGTGTRIVRSRDGLIASLDKLEEGILIERTLYYPNGTPKEHVTYNNSIIDGLKKTYLPDGEPATVEEWDNGYQHGLTIIYQHGEKFAEIPYNRGRKDGIERRYRDGKDLFQEVTWVEGLEGPTRNYAPR